MRRSDHSDARCVVPGKKAAQVWSTGLAGWRYIWPVALEWAVPLRRRRRVSLIGRRREIATGRSVPLVVLMVYRFRNVEIVETLIRQLPEEVDLRLWALDEIHPSVASHTVGFGQDPKFVAINRLLAWAPIPNDAWIAVIDDDVCFSHGDLGTCIAIGSAHGLHLFQPSHSWASIFTYPMLLHRPGLAARRTSFVEAGPMVIVAPAAREHVFPLPEELGMGWGVEVDWYRLVKRGVRLGIVDACRIAHFERVGRTYDPTLARDILRQRLRSVGRTDIYELMKTYERFPLGSPPAGL